METILEISNQRSLSVHLMPVPIALFRADRSVITMGLRRTEFFALWIASSFSKMLTETGGALVNASILSSPAKSRALNFSAIFAYLNDQLSV